MEWLWEILTTNFDAIGGILGALTFFLVLTFFKSLIKVAHPDKIMVITGKKNIRNSRKFGFSVERGRSVVLPYLQQLSTLDLGVLPINVRVEGVNAANGITVGADATACVCIDGDDDSMLYSAVERLMGKTREAIKEQIQQTLVGNFRGALNKATPLQAIGMDEKHESEWDDQESVTGDRALFRNELLKDINSDLSHFGVKVVSVSLQKIWDTSNYIANLAQKTLARKRKEVEIQEAKLQAKAAQAESDSARRIIVAQNQANEKILIARQKLEMLQKESEGSIQKASLEADSGISEAENRGQRDVQELLVELAKLTNKTKVTMEADNLQKASEIEAQGDGESASIIESARNEVLSKKTQLLASSKSGKLVLFLQTQLPQMFKEYQSQTSTLKVDNYVVMEGENGFNSAVNRGPGAFVDFLSKMEEAFGIKVKDFLTEEGVK